jgi:hypothetical protein
LFCTELNGAWGTDGRQQEMRNEVMEDHDNDKEYKKESPENGKKQSSRQDDDDEIPAASPFLLGEWKDKKQTIGSLSWCKYPLGLVGSISMQRSRATGLSVRIASNCTQCFWMSKPCSFGWIRNLMGVFSMKVTM